MNGFCDCCKRRGETRGVGAVRLCPSCVVSFGKSAAYAVSLSAKNTNHEVAADQFVAGKSCRHYIGLQLPA